MKKIQYIFIFFAALLLMASCEKSAPVVYTGSNFVHFEDSLISISESATKEDANGVTQKIPSLANIRINRATSDISKPLNVAFSVKAKYVINDTISKEPLKIVDKEVGDIPQGNFILSSASGVTIKAGEAFAFVTLSFLSNELTDGDKKITLTIESTSDASFTLGYPGSAQRNKSVSVKVIDDDCEFVRTDYLGNKVADDPAHRFELYSYPVLITPSGTSDIIIDDFYNFPGINSILPKQPIKITVNPITRTAIILDQPTTITVGGNPLRIVSDAATPIPTCSKQMRVQYRLYTSAIPDFNSGVVTYQ